ncbi:MAG TPA: O-antigen ligase family protein [Candidatus Sulfomarinibacteraceae bacterium]|nr:O-antigen ligase family protein [Candidatus Sulfomarinibacteraceae bacterium]
MRRFARFITRWQGLFLALLLPLVIVAPPLLAAALLLIPLLWMARKAATGRFVPATPFNVSLLLMVLMVLVSLYATFDIAFSFVKVGGVVYGVALLFAVADVASRSRRNLWLAVGLFMMGGLGAAGVSVLGAQWPRKLPLIDPLVQRMPQRLLSLPGSTEGFNPNEVAGVLLWIAPLALVLAAGLWLGLRRLRRDVAAGRLVLILLFVTGTALTLSSLLLLTQSRGGIIGFALALLLVMLLAAARAPRFALLALALLLLGGGFLAFDGRLSDRSWAENGLGGLVFEQSGISGDNIGDALNSLEGRREIWSRAIYGIQDFPITGMGMNTFRRVVPILYPLFLIAPDRDIAHAHNHLLQAALDLGLPGLVAYVAIWLGAGAMLWQSWLRAPTPWLRLLAVGCFASLLGYFIYGLVDAVALGARPGFLFWYLLGLVAALYRVVANSAERDGLRRASHQQSIRAKGQVS